MLRNAAGASRVVVLVYLSLGVSVLDVPRAFAEAPSEALKHYVEQADDSYGYVERQRARLGTCQVIELTLTSQTWRGLEWKHRLFLLVPEKLEKNTDALLVIEGGSWKASHAEPIPSGQAADYPEEAVLLAAYAQQLGCPIAVLLNVPRQPIFVGKKEDAIIALTFDEYLKTGETDWPLLLPMTKSAVKAMDAVQTFADESLGLHIDGFMVAGASKRGWTTWLTAAVDERVKGLAPMVIDMLNMDAQFDHQLASYGKFSERIHDYTDRDLPKRMRGEPGATLRQIVDPYSYRQQITQPKLIMLGTNDGYWTVDALSLYWDGLVGDKYVMYVPNADHDLAMDWQRIIGGFNALRSHINGNGAMPDLRWSYAEADGAGVQTLTVMPGLKEAKVYVWTATAPTRDFRKAMWTSSPLQVDDSGVASVAVPAADERYHALFAEVVYPRQPMPLYLSTTIRVVEPEQVK